jgi:hypothetical protein
LECALRSFTLAAELPDPHHVRNIGAHAAASLSARLLRFLDGVSVCRSLGVRGFSALACDLLSPLVTQQGKAPSGFH